MKKNKFLPTKELDYQFFLKDEKIRFTRIMCLLSAVLYGMFLILDFWTLQSSVAETVIVRGFVISALLVTFSSTYYPSFIKYYDYIMSGTFIIAFLGIEIMIYKSTPTDYAYETYFAGVILVLIALFSWTYLKMSVSISVASFPIIVYMYIEIFERGLVISDRLPAFLTNMFFIISAIVIGLIAQAMRDNYLRKNFMLQQTLEDAFQEKAKEAETHEHLANHDALTGLPNSRYASDRLEKNLQRAKELDMSLVIMYLDLNGFKQVNDIYGHRAGDEVLRIVGKRLKSCVRNGDCLARLGGDEFGVGLLVEKHELDIAQEIREKIEKAIAQPIGFEGNVLQIGTSVGMASYPSSGDKVRVLIEIADKRMYNAKQKMKKKALPEEETEYTFKQSSHPVVIFPG